MRDPGLQGARRGKAFKTTIPDTSASRPADRVDHQFVATRPDQLRVADLTYVATWRGFVFVAFVIDVFSVRGSSEDLIHHSDRGRQYVSIRYSERLASA